MFSFVPTISAAELTKARREVGLSISDLATLLEVPQTSVERWEGGVVRVPFQRARQVRWCLAILARARAIAASDIPECEWMNRFDEQPEPREGRERDRFLRAWHTHTTTCGVCLKRTALLKKRFPEVPPPMPIWLELFGFLVGEHVLLPHWLRLGVPVGLLFCVCSIAHVDFPLLRLTDRPGGFVVLDVFIATALGAALGIVAGAVRDALVQLRGVAESGSRRG
jgi:hypothetical protein